MNENWQKELCAVRPKEVEMLNTSTVIQRRNIEPYEREGFNGETESGYKCECRILPADEYIAEASQEENSNLLVSMGAQAALYEELQETKQNQLVIMGAIADLYETIGKGGGLGA